MISTLYVIHSQTVSAPANLAMEACLTDHVPPHSAILFFWQNEKTVVIGRNQNAWKECRLSELAADGGCLVRRLSGGGAVFHDLGNLNVSFCVPRTDEDIPRQTQVLLNALQTLGVPAVRSGRNDLEVDGRKFSGHAYYRTETSACHHATLMLKVDQAKLERYLRLSPDKMRSRGVESVRARVMNLSDLCPALTLPALKETITNAFSAVYGHPVLPLPWDWREPERFAELNCLKDRFASWEWTYGRRISFDLEQTARFAWGGIDLQLHIDRGRIKSCRCYTDAMEPEWTGQMEAALQEMPFTADDVCTALNTVPCQSPAEEQMRRDIEQVLLRITG